MSNCQHCERPAYVRGLCVAHYQRFRKYGDALEPSHKRTKSTCRIKDCGKFVQAQGLCNAHYKKLEKYGDPLAGETNMRGQSRLEQYEAKVDKRGPDECWPWTGGLNYKGYGQFANGNGGAMGAHRFGFEQFVRSLESGEIVDHVCHNQDSQCPGGKTCKHRRCQNPAHWEAVPTSAENTLRALERFEPRVRERLAAKEDRVRSEPGYNVAMNRFKTHCKWGHELTPENSYGYKGRRQCIKCARLAARGQHPRQLGLQPPSPPSAAA